MTLLFVDMHNRLLSLLSKYGEPFMQGVSPILPYDADFLFHDNLQPEAYVSPVISPEPVIQVISETNLIKSQSTSSSHSGYFPAQMRSKGSTHIFSLVLIDSGNCIKYDATVRKDLADRLDCAITHQPMHIGLAVSDFHIKALTC